MKHYYTVEIVNIRFGDRRRVTVKAGSEERDEPETAEADKGRCLLSCLDRSGRAAEQLPGTDQLLHRLHKPQSRMVHGGDICRRGHLRYTN